jgi:hypothetical protein
VNISGVSFVARAVAIVDPDFHEIGLARRQLLHGLARLLGARHREWHVVAGGISGPRPWIGKAAPDGQDARRIGDRLLAQSERKVAHIGAGADDRDDAVIGVALQMVDVVFAREIRLRHIAEEGIEETRMAVGVDNPRHDGLAAEIHARRARRGRDLAAAPDLRDAAVLDHESGIFDRRAAIAGDEPNAFEHHRVRRRLLTCGWKWRQRSKKADGKEQAANPCHPQAHGVPPRNCCTRCTPHP